MNLCRARAHWSTSSPYHPHDHDPTAARPEMNRQDRHFLTWSYAGFATHTRTQHDSLLVSQSHVQHTLGAVPITSPSVQKHSLVLSMHGHAGRVVRACGPWWLRPVACCTRQTRLRSRGEERTQRRGTPTARTAIGSHLSTGPPRPSCGTRRKRWGPEGRQHSWARCRRRGRERRSRPSYRCACTGSSAPA